ncbi:MAG: T9SS type A sorting domain-containing protein, partial [Bacteroidota bacterium]
GVLPAQSELDYAPFRTGIYYTFENTLPVPEWSTETPLIIPYFEMVWPETYGIEGWFTGFNIMQPTDIEGQYEYRSSFIGDPSFQSNDQSVQLLGDDGFFELHFSKPLGATWQAYGPLIASVDSIVEETFFGLTDSVKYIGIEDPNNSIPTRSIKISKQYGLLQTVFFANPIDYPQVFPLIGMSDPEVGQSIVTPYMIGFVFQGDEYYEEEVRPDAQNGTLGERVTQRVYRAGLPNCDPLMDASFATFLVQEISFFRSGLNGEQSDTIRVPQRWEHLFINFNPVPENWRALPVGTIHLSEEGALRLVDNAANDCLGVGKRLSHTFQPLPQPSKNYELSTKNLPSETYYPRVIYGSDVNLEEASNREIVGVRPHDFSCGTQFNFDPLYTSVRNFPDDPRITLSPNPTTDFAMLSLPLDLGAISYRLYAASGKLLHQSERAGGSRNLRMTDFPPGIYTVVIDGESGPIARRRLIVH